MATEDASIVFVVAVAVLVAVCDAVGFVQGPSVVARRLPPYRPWCRGRGVGKTRFDFSHDILMGWWGRILDIASVGKLQIFPQI